MTWWELNIWILSCWTCPLKFYPSDSHTWYFYSCFSEHTHTNQQSASKKKLAIWGDLAANTLQLEPSLLLWMTNLARFCLPLAGVWVCHSPLPAEPLFLTQGSPTVPLGCMVGFISRMYLHVPWSSNFIMKCHSEIFYSLWFAIQSSCYFSPFLWNRVNFCMTFIRFWDLSLSLSCSISSPPLVLLSTLYWNCAACSPSGIQCEKLI